MQSSTALATRFRLGFGLRGRLAGSAFLLAAEFLSVTIAIDTQSLVHLKGMAGLAGAAGPWGIRAILLATVLSVVLACCRAPWALSEPLPAGSREPGIGTWAFHSASFITFWLSAAQLVGGGGAGRDVMAVVAVIAGLATVVSAAVTLVPPQFWQRLFRAVPYAPAIGVLAAAGTLGVFRISAQLAKPWLAVTFDCAHFILRLFTGLIVVDRHSRLLGTPSFQVIIDPACSGYEGVAMMVIFGAAWLWFFRRDFRFPQALLLIPAGMAAIWVLNCLRLVALILIGSAGAPGIAAGGFHSQAGWMAFLLSAVAFAIAAQRVRWMAVKVTGPRAVSSPAGMDATAGYLLPFLAILAAGMVAQAASAGFEWLYPLRVLTAAGVLWWCRCAYAELDWRGSWLAVIAGGCVFAIWIAADYVFAGSSSSSGPPAAFVAAPQWQKISWLVFRTLGAVVTVPIAEELAFRGYLLRRMVAPDFTSVGDRKLTFFAVAASSVIFGVLHGRLWLPGVLAGAAYALVYRRRGRIGEAIVAHATTNALLAAWVAATGAWRLW